VASDCKRPLTKHGCKDATRDPEAIRAFWRAHPAANVAVACGAVSGVFVLDVDAHAAGANGWRTLAEMESRFGPLPPTWRTLTAGGGVHLWFARPEGRVLRNRVGFLPGLDCRTDGGSVAVPPSRRPDGEYSWLVAPWDTRLVGAPTWLLDLIDPAPPPRPPRAPFRLAGFDRTARYVARAIEGEAARVATAAPGNRNLELFKASARLGELVGAGLAREAVVTEILEDAATKCGLVRDDGVRAVRASIRSGLARGAANARAVR
jgi:putative DNA primase/helicase